MPVAASILPLADVVLNVGRSYVRVVTLLEPGKAPYDYRLSGDQVESVSAARLLVMVGPGVDEWARPARRGQAGPRVVSLGALFDRASDGARSEASQNSQDKDGTGSAGQSDPEVWLDPIKMIRITEVIAETLAQIDPEHAAAYRGNADAFKTKLCELNRRCRDEIAKLPRREYVALQPGFGHFAARYGLKQVCLDLPHGKRAELRQIDRIIEFVTKHEVKAVFAEPQFPVDQLEVISDRTQASVDRLDSVGAAGVIGHDTYIELMTTNLTALIQGLSK
ncbi:MAG: zinc ABC transporter substrate-binding protein [Phycisphaerae bacterium]|nr:zinc ABC transporter substrate-binding protein [Phycisphaerae bacterium]